AASIAIAARSSGLTPESAPSRRPIGVRTALKITALDIGRLDVRPGAAEQLRHRPSAFLAVAGCPFVHVHRHEPVGCLPVDAAAEALGICECLLAVVEADLDRLAENRGDIAEPVEIAA